MPQSSPSVQVRAVGQDQGTSWVPDPVSPLLHGSRGQQGSETVTMAEFLATDVNRGIRPSLQGDTESQVMNSVSRWKRLGRSLKGSVDTQD